MFAKVEGTSSCGDCNSGSSRSSRSSRSSSGTSNGNDGGDLPSHVCGLLKAARVEVVDIDIPPAS